MKLKSQMDKFRNSLRLTETPPAVPAGGGGGGGAAVATSPAPAPAPAAPSLAGGSPKFSPGGLFSGMRHEGTKTTRPDGKPDTTPPATQPAALKAPPAGAPASTPAEKNVTISQGQDGKWHAKEDATGAELGDGFESSEAAIAHLEAVEKGTATPSANVPAATPEAGGDPDLKAFHRPLLDRPHLNNFKAAEEQIRRSESEGVRLYQENKTLKEAHVQQLATRDTEVAKLKAEIEDIRTNGIFQELSKEQLDVLRKETPGEYADYIHKKDSHDRQVAEARQTQEREAVQRKERQEEVSNYLKQRGVEMAADKKSFPGYEEAQTIARQMFDLTKEGGNSSPLAGHTWTRDILYFAAKGWAAVQAEQAGSTAAEQAAETARVKAAADAAGAGSPGGSPSKGPNLQPQDPNRSWKDSIRKVAKPIHFKVGAS